MASSTTKLIDGELFKCLEARVVIVQWPCHYNEVRPDSELGYLTPLQFVRNLTGRNHEALFSSNSSFDEAGWATGRKTLL